MVLFVDVYLENGTVSVFILILGKKSYLGLKFICSLRKLLYPIGALNMLFVKLTSSSLTLHGGEGFWDTCCRSQSGSWSSLRPGGCRQGWSWSARSPTSAISRESTRLQQQPRQGTQYFLQGKKHRLTPASVKCLSIIYPQGFFVKKKYFISLLLLPNCCYWKLIQHPVIFLSDTLVWPCETCVSQVLMLSSHNRIRWQWGRQKYFDECSTQSARREEPRAAYVSGQHKIPE